MGKYLVVNKRLLHRNMSYKSGQTERKVGSFSLVGHPHGDLIYTRRTHWQLLMNDLSPQEAARFLDERSDALFIDVRSEMEYLFVGHPVGALHVPWNEGPDWAINSDFVPQVMRLAGTDPLLRPLVLICRSGNRSIDGGDALEKAGFRSIYNVLNGFEGDLDESNHRNCVNGWRREGLPWEQC